MVQGTGTRPQIGGAFKGRHETGARGYDNLTNRSDDLRCSDSSSDRIAVDRIVRQWRARNTPEPLKPDGEAGSGCLNCICDLSALLFGRILLLQLRQPEGWNEGSIFLQRSAS